MELDDLIERAKEYKGRTLQYRMHDWNEPKPYRFTGITSSYNVKEVDEKKKIPLLFKIFAILQPDGEVGQTVYVPLKPLVEYFEESKEN